MTLHYIPGRKQSNIVRAIVEKVAPDWSSMLVAARKTGLYKFDELPERIRSQVNDLEIPEYGIRLAAAFCSRHLG